MKKMYFSYKKEDMTFLFTSCANSIAHALFNGMFIDIKTEEELYSQVEHTFHMITEDEAKKSGEYEIVM